MKIVRLRRGRHSLGCSLIVLGCSTAPAAFAQQTMPASAVLEEVIVTAQKKAENIKDVAASISVVSGANLERSGASKLTDYAAYVPGLTADSPNGVPGQTRLSLRGLPPLSGSATVGTYLDDTPFGSSSSNGGGAGTALDLFPYDIERVEILRGPQGTLYGASTMGGLVKYVMRSPSLNEAQARVGGDVATIKGAGDPSWGARASVDMPIIAGVLGLGVSAFQEQTSGYIDNAVTGAKDENEVVQKGGRAVLLWQPQDGLSIKLTTILQNVDSDENSTVALSPETRRPLFRDLQAAHLLGQPANQELRYYSATVNWNLPWADFVSASSYSRLNTESTQDASATLGALFPIVTEALPQFTDGVVVPAGLAPFLGIVGVKKFTQEFRLASPTGGRLDWRAGAFYTHETTTNVDIVRALDADGAPIAGLDPFFDGGLPAKYREYAVFGDTTYRFSERFDVTAGVRWARNDQDFAQADAGPLAVLFGSAGNTPGDSSEDNVLYSLSPRVHLSKDTMLYARVATGYRPGGPNVRLPGIPPTFDSDTLTSYEAGLKSTFLSGTALVDVAVYRVNWRDIQITAFDPTGTFNFEANGGTARTQGVELTSTFAVLDGLRLGFNIGYTDAKLTEDVPSLDGLSGDRLPFVPRVNGSVSADYEAALPGGWTSRIGGGVRYVSHRDSAFPNDPRSFELSSYSVIDLNATVSNDRWEVGLFAKNLADRRAYLTYDLSLLPSQLDSAVLQPRTIGVSFDMKF